MDCVDFLWFVESTVMSRCFLEGFLASKFTVYSTDLPPPTHPPTHKRSFTSSGLDSCVKYNKHNNNNNRPNGRIGPASF